MHVSKTFCDGERDFLSEMKEGCKISCAKILLACLLGSQYLLEILEIIKNSEHVVKNGCFEKYLRRKAPTFFPNESEI